MNITNIVRRLPHSSMSRLAIAFLITLVWSSLAFCGQIHYAAAAGDLAMVKRQLEYRPDLVSSKDDEGNTPLHIAVEFGHKEVMELLLAKGADVNARDEDGWTPLHMAAAAGYKDVVELLRQHGGHE